MRFSKVFSNETGATPVLILIAVIGLMAFLALSSVAPLKSGILSSLFPKVESRAASELKDQIRTRPIPDEYIVVLKNDVTNPDAVTEDLKQKNNLEIKYKYNHGIKGFSAKIPANNLNAVKGDPKVRYVEQDIEVAIPNSQSKTIVNKGKSECANKWLIFPPSQEASTGLQRIGGSTDGVHQTLPNKGSGVGVAILDSGVALDHDDLVVQQGVSFVPGNNADDDSGHGTHVAGIIAAADNNCGVVGVAPEASIYPVKVLNKNGKAWVSNPNAGFYGTDEPDQLVSRKSSIVAGVDWVTAQAGPINTHGKIQIANMSLGWFGPTSPSNDNCTNANNDSLHESICLSTKAGITYVVSVGNEYSDSVSVVPASYEEVITVSALADFDGQPAGLSANTFTNQTYCPGRNSADDSFACFSNYGGPVDISAPGVNIRSTILNGFSEDTGTSMATPFVTGAAALYKSTHPNANPTEIKQYLIDSAEPIDIPGDPDQIKEGVLRIGQAPSFTFTTQPSGGNPGTEFSTQPKVTLKYPNGQVVKDFNKPVTITIKAGTGTPDAVLSGNTTVNAVNGVATFSGLSIDKPGNGYILVASAKGAVLAESAPFELTNAGSRIERVNITSDGTQANGGGFARAPVSSDGRYVAFMSESSNLVPGDTNNEADIFVKDRQTGVIERVSSSSEGVQGNTFSGYPTMTPNGRFVAFLSNSNNLVTNDTNGVTDYFVKDRQTGVTVRVNEAADGSQADDGISVSERFAPAISANGRFIAFSSAATNLVPGDTNNQNDVFVKDLQTGMVNLASSSSDGSEGNGLSGGYLGISGNGQIVVFSSFASNLVIGDINLAYDVFSKDLITGEVELVSRSGILQEFQRSSNSPSISDDGRFVTFVSEVSNLVPGDVALNKILFKDRQTDIFERISFPVNGDIPNSNTTGNPVISSDGRFVVFLSEASNLVPEGTNGARQVFLKDRQTGTLQVISVSADGDQANTGGGSCDISADGRYVTFYSNADNLVPGDTNGASDVFIVDRTIPLLDN